MGERWNHNLHYHPLVLRSLPSPCGRALDVGCGEGALTRQLAERCGEVLGIDLDAGILPIGSGNISFVTGDVMVFPFQAASFDCIAAVATLHHLPLRPALQRLRDLLRPGGVLVIVGLFRANTLREHIRDALALPLSYLTRLLRGYTEARAHTKPPEQTYAEITEATQLILPGAILKRRLFFRYSLIWRKQQMPR